jgi:hypothetical protein
MELGAGSCEPSAGGRGAGGRELLFGFAVA